MRLRGRHYATGAMIDVVCEGERITAVEPPSSGDADLEAGWLAPALFDLQINGGGGIGFVSPTLTREEVHRVVELCWTHGLGGLCPTLITGSFEALAHGFGVLRQACDQSREMDRAMPCFHLEGPYISPDDGPRGAHLKTHVRPPNREEFARWQDAAGGRIRLVTLAPEIEGALGFIEWLVQRNCVVAIGHTAASPAIIRDAVSAGARLSTHLGNGSHAFLPRHDNYLWEQAASEGLMASLITDGHHLPASVVRCLIRAKRAAQVILTCDASCLAGCAPGRYRVWEQELEVQPGGRVGVPGTPFLAGSGVFTDDCLGWLLKLDEMSLTEAIDSATKRPRELLGVPEVSLVAGSPADVVLFDHDEATPFRVRGTVVVGRMVSPLTLAR